MTREEFETRNAVLNFLGTIYQEVSKVDKNIVGANSHLRPKKEEFTRLAESAVMSIQNDPTPSIPTNDEILKMKEEIGGKGGSVSIPQEMVNAVIGIDNTLKGLYTLFQQIYGTDSKINDTEQEQLS